VKCFYSGTDAVGICKACGRGLSLAFAAEFPRGLACKNRCEEDVQRWIRLVDVNDKLDAVSAAAARNQRASSAVSGGFCILAGGGFLYFTGFGGGWSLPNFMGAAFVVYGVYALARAAGRR
jgi:hypothetical protein